MLFIVFISVAHSLYKAIAKDPASFYQPILEIIAKLNVRHNIVNSFEDIVKRQLQGGGNMINFKSGDDSDIFSI